MSRRRALVAGFVALPTAIAVLLAAWRVGAGWRQTVREADLALARRVAGAWESHRRGGPALDGAVAAAEAPSRVVYDHAYYRRAGERLVRDADGWQVVGAVLMARREALPPPIPPTVLAWGLLAWLLVVTGASWFGGWSARRAVEAMAGNGSGGAPGRTGTPAVRRAGGTLAGSGLAVVVLLPAAAYATYVISEGGGLGALVSLGAAAVAAAIGLSLLQGADRGLRLRQALHGWAFLTPSLLHLLLFSVGPVLFCLYLSFHEWNLVESARPFVGLENYRTLVGDADFGRAVLNTGLYVFFVPVAMAVALGLALLVNRRFRGVGLLRTVFFLPYVTSFVAISLVWKWMYEPEFGLLNNILGRLGLPEGSWLSAPATAMPSLMLMSVWMFAGYIMVIFLAGLQNIPESLYESARIDGAGAWQRFRHITLPMLRPTTLFVLVTMVIFMFQVFTAVYVMTEGGPLHATDVVVYHIYRNAWEYLRMGYASAMAWVLFAIVFVITMLQWKWLGGRVES